MACSSAEPTADLSDVAIETDATAASEGFGSNDESTPRSGGILRVLLGCRDSLDPVVGDCHELYDEVYARLVSISDDPSNPIDLDLAETYTVSDDGMEYTFTLRRDLKFSDGSPLTAQDFKWSWERALDPDSGSETAVEVLGGIVGAAEVVAGGTNSLHGVRFVDDRTLIVELTTPRPLFLYEVADHVATPLSRNNTKSWQVEIEPTSQFGAGQVRDALPVGTGPFRVSEIGIDGGIGVRIEANPHYHRGQPLLVEVLFVPLEIDADSGEQVDLAGTMLAMFESGAIDIAPYVSSDAVSSDGINFNRTFTDGIALLAFNTAKSPLNDLHVRRAIVAASNVTESFDPVAAYSLLWDGLPSYDPEVAVDRFDPESARGEIELSEFASLQSLDPLTLCYWNSRSDGLVFRIYSESLVEGWMEHLGIRVRESNRFQDACLRDADIVSVRIEPRFPDPHEVLAPVVTLLDQEGEDYGRAAAMIEEASRTADTVARLARYAEVERYLLEQSLVLPLLRDSVTVTEHIRNTVRGYAPKRYGGSVYGSVWLEEAAQ